MITVDRNCAVEMMPADSSADYPPGIIADQAFLFDVRQPIESKDSGWLPSSCARVSSPS